MPTCGTIQVRPEFSASNVSVGSCTGGAEVTKGDNVTVTATVQNENNTSASVEVELSIDGSAEATTTTTVAANTSRDVNFTVDTSGLSEGEHSVSAGVSGAQRA